MKKQNIVFLDTDTIGLENELSKFNEFGDVFFHRFTSNNELEVRIKDASILVTNKVVIDKNAIDNAKNLKLICVAATGMNNIDLEYAKLKGIEVKNVINYSTSSVVQYVFSSLLNVLSSPNSFNEYVKNGSYSNQHLFTHLGFPIDELKGKTFGIIGMGTIGQAVAKVAEAFGCFIIYYSTSGDNNSQSFELCKDLKIFLQRADIVSINCPLNNNTKNLITKKELKYLKPSCILINAGRGGIVDEIALSDSLNNNELRMAILDVFATEPLTINSPLFKVPSDKIQFSPHIAWASIQARERLLSNIKENIRQFIAKNE